MARRDDGEFTEFAAACRPQLLRTAFLMCGDWDRAADLAQEALLRLYVAWPRLDHRAGMRTYATRAVVTIAIDQSRRRSSRERVGHVELHDRAPDPAARVTERAVLVAALRELPPRQRACVVLRHYEDLSVDEVARLLGCREGTVKSQTAKGLASLRAALERHGWTMTLTQDEPRGVTS